jgi:Fanconi anemia group M protein
MLKKKCNIEEKQLKVGDYLLSKRVCVERKAIGDFLQSIVDSRLFKQLSNMNESYDNPVLIIEGDENIFTERKIHENAINGALASIAIDYAIPILWTKNQLETANLLFAIARREQTDMKKSIRLREKIQPRSENEESEFLLSGLPNISTVLAKRLLKHFGSPLSVFNASIEQLLEVEGVGKEKAEAIYKVLRRKYEKSILED